MEMRETVRALPDEQVETAMYRARRAGREAGEDGRGDESVFWGLVLRELTREWERRAPDEVADLGDGG